MTSSNDLTIEQLEQIVTDTIANPGGEQHAKDKILVYIDFNGPDDTPASLLLHNIYDEELDGAYTTEETEQPFTASNLDSFLSKCQISHS